MTSRDRRPDASQSPTSALVSRTRLVNDINDAVMVRTRSGFDSNEHASTNKGCCKRLLREFFLCMVDLSILMMGVLRAPLTGRVIVALVLRLLLYFTNGVALYALTATVLQNGRPAHPSGDDQFLADLVNALLQPAQYVNTQSPPPTNKRLRRSIGFHPNDISLPPN